MKPEHVGRWPTELKPVGHWLPELGSDDTELELELVVTAETEPELDESR